MERARMNRSGFVRSTAAAAAAVAFLRRGALGATMAQGEPVLSALVATIVPIGQAQFPPIGTPLIVARIDALYHLSTDPVFGASLQVFDNLAGFAVPSPTLLKLEQMTLRDGLLAALQRRDATSFEASKLDPSSKFIELSTNDRTRYLGLWQHSAFNTRRRFYQSIRAATYAALYSMPESWNAIGYAGPLIGTMR
jgi:hypothetical protein